MTALVARRAFVGATAAALGIGLGQAMPFPHSHWAVITALTLLRPGAEGTARRTLYRVIATLGGAWFVIGIYAVGDPQPRWIVPLAILTIGISYSLVHLTPATYAVVLFAITGGGFALEALNDPLDAPYLVGYRIFHICVGSILVFCLSTLLRARTPMRAGDLGTLGQGLDLGLRTALACGVCVALAAVIELPSFAGSMVITVCVLAARPGYGESRRTGIQRLGGAVFGGALALGYYTFILDSATSVWSLMVVVFVVSWFSVIMSSIPSVSYLGFQIGFVFAWSIGDARSPSGDLWIPLDRIAQVAMGSLVFLLCQRLPSVPAGQWIARWRTPS